MNKPAHKIYLTILVLLVLLTLGWLIVQGYDYYSLSLENRFFHHQHNLIKPSGLWGHGFGVIGSFFIVVGVFSYMARKRFRKLSRLGYLKHWLEFHIFLCVLGPNLVLFHTSFKFGGIVAISFWSMVAVVASGVLGRFIYLQIPRTLEGRELSQGEISLMQQDFLSILPNKLDISQQIHERFQMSLNNQAADKGKTLISRVILRYFSDRKLKKKSFRMLDNFEITHQEKRLIRKSFAKEISVRRKMDLLISMQNLLAFWHVAHLPFALIMLIIMLVHVIIVVIFGYKWVF